MAQPDPSGGFDPVEFKASIRAAMLMGTPNMVEDRVTFRFAEVRLYDDVDAEGSPFDWETVPTDVEAPDPVQVLCAVETIGQGEASEGTNMGTFDMNRARLYLFAEEWELVRGFTTVDLSQSEYIRVKELPLLALFEVDIHVVEIHARDEN